LKIAKFIRSSYLYYLSSPASDRWLYRLMRDRGVSSIVELGVGMGARASRMIEVALSRQRAAAVRYVGIDLFETRPQDKPGMTIKRAHKVLSPLGARVHLMPGDPFTALSRAANTLAGVDLLVIGADQDRESLAWAWFYVPRMLHEQSLVCLEGRDWRRGRLSYRLVSRSEVDALAAARHGVWQRVA
jgi:predicted O-methyltransferase YrrM